MRATAEDPSWRPCRSAHETTAACRATPSRKPMPLAPATTSPGLVRIGEFVLNVPLREIYSPHLKDIVRIAPKSLAVLAALIEQQGQVVSSAALKSAVGQTRWMPSRSSDRQSRRCDGHWRVQKGTRAAFRPSGKAAIDCGPRSAWLPGNRPDHGDSLLAGPGLRHGPGPSAVSQTGSAVVRLTVRSASVDCTRTTPGSCVRILVCMRSKSAESA